MVDIEEVYNKGIQCDFCVFIARNGSDMMNHLIDLHPEDTARHYLVKQMTLTHICEDNDSSYEIIHDPYFNDEFHYEWVLHVESEYKVGIKYCPFCGTYLK